MFYNKKNSIVRDSKSNFYKFYICRSKLVLENNKIGQVLLKENVLEYAVDIDKNDKIHIVFFTSKGELYYVTYFNKEFKEKNMLLVNKKYILKLLNIKIIFSTTHLFYEIDNLDTEIKVIYHNYFCEGQWIDNKIAEPYCPQYVSSYCIDYRNNYIYIIYPKSYDAGEYRIKTLDVESNKWENFENTIIIEGATNLNFFITPNNTGLICFNKLINSNFQIMMGYRDFNVTNSLWSFNINVSNNDTNAFKPIAFYSNNNIYIIWKQGNSIVYKKSSDMLHWSEEYILDVEMENVYYRLCLSNNFKNYNFKINSMYITSIEFLYSIINFKSDRSCDTITADILCETHINLNNNTIACSEINYDKVIKNKDGNIKALLNEIKSKDGTIISLNEVNLELTKQIETLKNLINQYEDELENIRIEQALDTQNHSETIYKCQNEIKSLEEEKNKLVIDMNKKIKSLLKIIEEKEKIIQKLYGIIRHKM